MSLSCLILRWSSLVKMWVEHLMSDQLLLSLTISQIIKIFWYIYRLNPRIGSNRSLMLSHTELKWILWHIKRLGCTHIILTLIIIDNSVVLNFKIIHLLVVLLREDIVVLLIFNVDLILNWNLILDLDSDFGFEFELEFDEFEFECGFTFYFELYLYF